MAKQVVGPGDRQLSPSVKLLDVASKRVGHLVVSEQATGQLDGVAADLARSLLAELDTENLPLSLAIVLREDGGIDYRLEVLRVVSPTQFVALAMSAEQGVFVGRIEDV